MQKKQQISCRDVKRSVKSASWQIIFNELLKMGINEIFVPYCHHIVSETTMLVYTKGAKKTRTFKNEVLQGSVLGPSLPNVLYAEFLRMKMLNGFNGIVMVLV